MHRKQSLKCCMVLVLWLKGAALSHAQETYNNFPELVVLLNGDKFGDEDLTITAPHPHRYEFGIITPKGMFLFVYTTLQNEIAMDNPNQIMGFWDSTTLLLNTSTLKGVYYKDGQPIAVKVFTDPGLYCLHFSSNFETDPGGTNYQAIDIQWPSPEPFQKGLNNGRCQDDFFQSH